MQVTKALILSLLCILQASDTSATTDSTGVSSSSSPSSSSQVASSSSSSNVLLSRDPVNKRYKLVSKSGMNKLILPFDMLEYIAKFNPDSYTELIFSPKIQSLDEWIMASKEIDLPAMFKDNLGECKRWDILIAISK